MVLDILDREGGAVRMTIGAVVRKEFIGEEGVRRVSQLVDIYDLLNRKNVANVDTLVGFNLNSSPHVCLKPVGVAGWPASGSEALSAVVCVLKALKVSHDVSDYIL